MNNLQLGPHFTLNELLKSDTATRNNFTEQFNPSDDLVLNGKQLVLQALEPLRLAISRKLGRDVAIIVTSAYRCPRVNGSVPGSANHSQHEDFCAADTHVEGMTVREWYEFVKNEAGVDLDQVIEEHELWCHVSFDWRKKNQRRMCLIATGTIADPVYTPDGSVKVA